MDAVDEKSFDQIFHRVITKFNIPCEPDSAEYLRKLCLREGRTELKRVAPKTQGSVRELVCDPPLIELLRDLRRSAPGPVDEGHFVVCFLDGNPVDPDATTAWLRNIGRSVGVAATPHKLRHTAATMMLNHGAAITTVSSVLGHTDIRTTSNYARVLDDTKRGAIEALGRAIADLPEPNSKTT